MIPTVTPNLSIDRTITLGSALTRGAVHRVASVSAAPGGKGVNVARALTLAGIDALAASFGRAAPDLIKPNSEELPSITGTAADDLEAAAAQGDPEPVVAAARKVIDRGARTVPATLGAAGAVLVDRTGSWLATPAPVAVRSTVGAGDSSLAGYLCADVAGADAPERLRMAVAYGSAAAALPGSALPSPTQVGANDARVQPISRQPVNQRTEGTAMPESIISRDRAAGLPARRRRPRHRQRRSRHRDHGPRDAVVFFAIGHLAWFLVALATA